MPSAQQIRFLEKSLEASHQLRTAHDSKANFLLGVSSVLFVLSLNQYQNQASHFLVLAIFSLLAAIFCVYSISLPYRRISPLAKESIFCWWGVKGRKYEDYLQALEKRVNDDDDLVREYSQEIYSLYYDSIRHKTRLLKLAAFSLLAGFIAELIFLVL